MFVGRVYARKQFAGRPRLQRSHREGLLTAERETHHGVLSGTNDIRVRKTALLDDQVAVKVGSTTVIINAPTLPGQL